MSEDEHHFTPTRTVWTFAIVAAVLVAVPSVLLALKMQETRASIAALSKSLDSASHAATRLDGAYGRVIDSVRAMDAGVLEPDAFFEGGPRTLTRVLNDDRLGPDPMTWSPMNRRLFCAGNGSGVNGYLICRDPYDTLKSTLASCIADMGTHGGMNATFAWPWTYGDECGAVPQSVIDRLNAETP